MKTNKTKNGLMDIVVLMITIMFIAGMIIGLYSCTSREVEYVEEYGTSVDSVWKRTPISIHDDISPRWNFRTTDGQIHSTIKQPKVGDTVIYKKVHLRK